MSTLSDRLRAGANLPRKPAGMSRETLYEAADELDRLTARAPLTEDQIRTAVEELGGSDLWMVVGAYFRAGVRFAEKTHGVGA